MYRQGRRDPWYWTSPINCLYSPLDSNNQCTGKCSQLCEHLKNSRGLFGIFIHLPINTSVHTELFNCTYQIYSHSVFYTTLLHNITKGEYYRKHITIISTRRHQITGMFQCRNQYQVKYKEIDITIPPNTQPYIPEALV